MTILGEARTLEQLRFAGETHESVSLALELHTTVMASHMANKGADAASAWVKRRDTLLLELRRIEGRSYESGSR